jgi:DNA-binding transcriptional regulator PaaX
LTLPNLTIEMILNTWANQASYPLVYAKRIYDSIQMKQVICNCVYTQHKRFERLQERYYQNSQLKSHEQWWIPISAITDNSNTFYNTTPMSWLGPGDVGGHLYIPPSEWFILNTQQTGIHNA